MISDNSDAQSNNSHTVLNPAKRRLFHCVALGIVFVVAELVTTFFYSTYLPSCETMRLRLLGDPLTPFQRCIGQPYLLYVPAPNDTRYGQNAHGYRGELVARERTPRVARILCLGGSTTYGWSVDNPLETYPAQLQAQLRQSLPTGFDSVDVINAGLPYGTSAEMLTHYHFKYHYYRPDLVILHTGGNDADAMGNPHYQPDYSHWRRQPQVVQPLPWYTRHVMHSKFLSFVFISLVHGAAPGPMSILVRRPDETAPVDWYRPLPGEDRTLGFRHNLDSLIAEIRQDGAEVLLMPYRIKPNFPLPAAILEYYAADEQVLTELATDDHVTIAPLPDGTLSPDNFVDYVHLNAKGESEKAAHVLPYARLLLTTTASKPVPTANVVADGPSSPNQATQ